MILGEINIRTKNQKTGKWDKGSLFDTKTVSDKVFLNWVIRHFFGTKKDLRLFLISSILDLKEEGKKFPICHKSIKV